MPIDDLPPHDLSDDLPDDLALGEVILPAFDQVLRQVMRESGRSAAILAIEIGLPEATLTAFMEGRPGDDHVRSVLTKWAEAVKLNGKPPLNPNDTTHN